MTDNIDLQKQLYDWATKTMSNYICIASDSRNKADLAFYTQSDLTKLTGRPKLCIIGINPGSTGSFSDQFQNKNWNYLFEDIHSPNHILKGNYCHADGKPSSWELHTKWKYWSGLRRYFANTSLLKVLDEDDGILVTNASFFNTPKANAISDELLRKTLPDTLRLIDITSPETIVFLSGKACFGRLSRLSKLGICDFEFKNVADNIFIGKLNGRTCIGVPHPTYRSNAEITLIATVLPYLLSTSYGQFDDTQIKMLYMTQNVKSSHCNKNNAQAINQADVIQLLSKHYSKIPNEQKRFEFYNGLEATADKDSINIRHKGIKGKAYSNDLSVQPLFTEEIRGLLVGKFHFDNSDNAWIGCKKYKEYGQNIEDIKLNIIGELNNIGKQLETLHIKL